MPMTKLETSPDGCPNNKFTFVTENAKWICGAKTWKSGATRQRLVTSHVLNHPQLWEVCKRPCINDIYEAVESIGKGIEL